MDWNSVADFKARIAEETLEFAADQIDHALTSLISRGATDEEILALVRERLEEARQGYQDFLSLPDV
jgi:DNA-binding transcriptional regulator YhcF (GntR family)